MTTRIATTAVVAVLLAAIAGWFFLQRGGDGDAVDDLTVTWGGSEGDPACVYNANDQTVDAKLTIDGDAGQGHEVKVTVTAYADENTSKPVGSSSRSVEVEGTVHQPLLLTIPVKKPPNIDDDGIASCKLAVE